LTGLADNDHPQYRLTADAIDHGALGGLADNDHPQYLLTTGKAANADKLDNIDSTGFVQTSGNQTVGGIKTFSSIPVLPSTNPSTANQAVRKGYADATYLGITAKAADSDKLDGKTFTDIMALIYPVGAIYISTSSTSPATLFGGTWEAYGRGRVLVGKADSGTFATAGSTGGSETHSHGLASGFAKITASTSGWIAMARKATASWTTTNKNNAANNTSTGDSVSTGAELGGSTDNGSSLQPYVVVYMWRRTA